MNILIFEEDTEKLRLLQRVEIQRRFRVIITVEMNEEEVFKPFPSEGRFEIEAMTATFSQLVLWMTQTQNPYQLNVIRAEMQKHQLRVLIETSKEVANSSKRLEWLTGVLIFFTIVLALDVANKFRQEYFSDPPRLTGPQTPVTPAR